MSIKATRACVDAILDGSINKTTFEADPVSIRQYDVQNISFRSLIEVSFSLAENCLLQLLALVGTRILIPSGFSLSNFGVFSGLRLRGASGAEGRTSKGFGPSQGVG